jgi:predicted transcriptional regulator
VIEKLAPRERQVFEAVCRLGRATAGEVERELPDRLSNSAVRAMLSRLQAKGFLERVAGEGGAYLYIPKVSPARERQSALGQVVGAFFGGSPASAAMALLGMREKITPQELDELEAMIRKARQEQPS